MRWFSAHLTHQTLSSLSSIKQTKKHNPLPSHFTSSSKVKTQTRVRSRTLPTMEYYFTVGKDLKSQPWWVLALFFIGSLRLLKLSLSLLNWVYVNFLRPAKTLTKYGAWALVTGPTDGIGKAFAFQLARKSLNLVLVGRSPTKLKDVADAIQAKHPKALVKTVVVDFSSDELDEGVRRIKESVEGLDVGVLVNNVGVSYPYARYFHEVDEDLLRSLVRVNVEGTTKVTQAVLPGMLERKRGAIVNIGSAAGIIPSDPLYAVYAATKGYVDQFSRCLNVEYKNKGIDVQCQVPLYVATKMASIKKSSFFVPSTDAYVKAALNKIGYEARCTPYWPHTLLWALAASIPESIFDAWRLRFSLGIRKRGQLKDARNKKD